MTSLELFGFTAEQQHLFHDMFTINVLRCNRGTSPLSRKFDSVKGHKVVRQRLAVRLMNSRMMTKCSCHVEER